MKTHCIVQSMRKHKTKIIAVSMLWGNALQWIQEANVGFAIGSTAKSYSTHYHRFQVFTHFLYIHAQCARTNADDQNAFTHTPSSCSGLRCLECDLNGLFLCRLLEVVQIYYRFFVLPVCGSSSIVCPPKSRCECILCSAHFNEC